MTNRFQTLFLTLLVSGLAVPAFGDETEIEKGRVVFNNVAGIGCKTCHGDFAEGDLGVGPFIRGATEGTIRASIDATGEMVVVKNVISDEEIVSVAAYIHYLGTMQVARTLSKRGRFLPESFATRPATQVQIVIKNSGIQPATYQSDNMNIETLIIPGRSTSSMEWSAPVEEGDYAIYCSDCKLKDQFFVINVDANAPQAAASVGSASAGN